MGPSEKLLWKWNILVLPKFKQPRGESKSRVDTNHSWFVGQNLNFLHGSSPLGPWAIQGWSCTVASKEVEPPEKYVGIIVPFLCIEKCWKWTSLKSLTREHGGSDHHFPAWSGNLRGFCPLKWTDLGIIGRAVPWGIRSAIELRTMGVVIIKFGHLSLQIGGSSYKTKMNMDEHWTWMNMDELYHFIKAEATTCEIHNLQALPALPPVWRDPTASKGPEISSCSVVV